MPTLISTKIQNTNNQSFQNYRALQLGNMHFVLKTIKQTKSCVHLPGFACEKPNRGLHVTDVHEITFRN